MSFLLITLAIVVWTIITVESTLVYNSISGVYSIGTTGQLIPFIIGIVGMGKTINSIIISAIKKVSFEQGNIRRSLLILIYEVRCTRIGRKSTSR